MPCALNSFTTLHSEFQLFKFVSHKDLCIFKNFTEPSYLLLLHMCICFGEKKKKITQMSKILNSKHLLLHVLKCTLFTWMRSQFHLYTESWSINRFMQDTGVSLRRNCEDLNVCHIGEDHIFPYTSSLWVLIVIHTAKQLPQAISFALHGI